MHACNSNTSTLKPIRSLRNCGKILDNMTSEWLTTMDEVYDSSLAVLVMLATSELILKPPFPFLQQVELQQVPQVPVR